MLFIATSEVFSMMVGSEVTPASRVYRMQPTVTGSIGIAGAVRASLTLRCSHATAAGIASQMLGIAEQAQAHACDAVGEICNMVAGHFKAKVGLEAECMLSVPLVIQGNDYEIQPVKDAERIDVPLLYQGELLEVTLEIHP